jgi:flavin-dependent dehydrogenase
VRAHAKTSHLVAGAPVTAAGKAYNSAVVYDVLIIGGGPAGSSCARGLTAGGASVAIVDRAVFPRMKLCGGWVSGRIWDALELAPREYPGGLWEWHTCHVHHRGESRAVPCHGWFIRRFELDDFLLGRSGAALHLGVDVRDIARDEQGLWSIEGLRGRHLVGAGGTHCPVARLWPPPRRNGPVGAQENEFAADRAAIARARIGGDGEPELYLHDDLDGYSWNVPKTDWLNLGSGTADPKLARRAWQTARAHFSAAGHLPDPAPRELDSMKGHTYYLYDPIHLQGAARAAADGAGSVLLCGDSLGLAHPLTAEGILAAVISGRIAAEAILAGAPESYAGRLAGHPVLADYGRVFRLRQAAISRTPRRARTGEPTDRGRIRERVWRAPRMSRLGRRAIARGFAWMFSGARLPAPRLLDLALGVVERGERDPTSSSRRSV